MVTLFHFILTLVKIFFQTLVYATLSLLIFRLLAKGEPNGYWDVLSRSKTKFWFISGAIISVSLLVFSFTTWGNHGLGDSYAVPIGHGKSVHNIDNSWTYFYPTDFREQRHILTFVVKEDKLFAEQEDNKYLIYDLESYELVEFDSPESYEKYANQNGFPLAKEFKEFQVHYDKYWNGWRSWLLP
jgi:hypothetical protein